MIKRWIIKLFKIKTYEEEYHKFKKLYEVTLDELNMTRTVAESYRANLEDIKSTCDEVINKAEKVVAEFENPERRKENYEHRAYANGRRDAYAEMGIKALNARINGENLYIDENDNIIEEMNEEAFNAFCKEHEIEIDDLIEGEDDE